MAKKCSKCEFCKTYAEKKGINGRLFTMVCTKDFPNTPAIGLFENIINKEKWESLECSKEQGI